MAPITVEYFTDPFSGRCWAAEPLVRRLQYAYDVVEVTPRTTTLLAPGDPDAPALARESLVAARDSAMPIGAAPWSPEDPPSSRPACAAVAAVRERSPAVAGRFLRRLREQAFVVGDAPTTPDALVALAADVDGADRRALAADLEDGTADAALVADLERAHAAVADDHRTLGAVREVPLDPRRVDGLPETADADETADDGDAVADDGDAVADEDAGEAAGNGDDAGEAAEGGGPRIVAPPAALFERDGTALLVGVDGRYDPLKEAVTTLAPDADNALADPAPLGTKELTRRGYGFSEEFAEHVTDRDHGAMVEEFLDRAGGAFLREVASSLDLAEQTCRMALFDLLNDGAARRVDRGEETLWLPADG
jgi:predicted DsbA family dithiol-disulfide isomerase